ncbi:MAG: hypothetical protein L0H84_12770 [Pseudonocardia sp.]|nr:hypothetical protein [Pseudonocardia sp.]
MWPIERATMFASAWPDVAEPYVVGYDRWGVEVAMPAEQFGVAPTELSAQLGRAILPDVGPEDGWVLAELAAWWNTAHPDRRVVVLHLRVKVTDLRGGFAEHHETLLSWAGP